MSSSLKGVRRADKGVNSQLRSEKDIIHPQKIQVNKELEGEERGEEMVGLGQGIDQALGEVITSRHLEGSSEEGELVLLSRLK